MRDPAFLRGSLLWQSVTFDAYGCSHQLDDVATLAGRLAGWREGTSTLASYPNVVAEHSGRRHRPRCARRALRVNAVRAYGV